MRLTAVLLGTISILVPLTATAQADYVQEHYVKREVTIPMRDGVKLFTSIYSPKSGANPAPFLMMRTPYSCSPYGGDAYRASLGPEGEFTKEGYIFVYQDVRGRYMSEGDFHWMNPSIPNKKPGQVDESTDTYDTIEWLLKNVSNNNGRVGVYGTSFPGHYAAQCLLDPHPALKAASPQAPMVDNWLGDDMHHNGAFFLPHAMNFIAGFGKVRQGPTQNYGPGVFSHDTPDGYRFFLEMGPLKNALTKYNMEQIPLWKEWMKHGDYDEYWQAQNVSQNLKKAGKVAILTVGGFWDAEDLYGPLDMYKAIERNTPNNDSKLVMGPWYHGSWNGGPGDSLHDIRWNTKCGDDFRNTLQRPFFRYHLWQDAPKPEIADATMFDVGADKWRTFAQWPPKEAATVSFWPKTPAGSTSGALDTVKSATARSIEWISDPFKPVPCSNTISVGMPRSYMIEDQRFVWGRPDVLSFETPTLSQDLTVTGPVKATLFVSTTGTDADFVVKVIDVYPNNAPNNSPRGSDVPMGGYQMMVRGEPFRAKYRNSWSKPSPMAPGKVEKVEITMPDICYTFKAGHKLMVQVQSTWFPLIDRNPQTFTDIFNCDASAFRTATHKLYTGGAADSRVSLAILK